MSAGHWEGEACCRNGCKGVIELEAKGDCSCHISPPCGACVNQAAFCPVCDWSSAEEVTINDYVVQIDKATGNYKWWEPRPLDNTKIDWRSQGHTNASMIKEGVFPIGTSRADVEKEVMGTFGGRFEKFNAATGTFKYIAYTD